MKELEIRDIHLPDAVSWWPPAMGWWVSLLIVILLLALVWWWLKQLKKVRVQNKALDSLLVIKQDFSQHQDKTLLSQQISQLLRQILLSTNVRADVASVTGQQWLDALNQCHPKGQFELKWIELLSISPYQKQSDFAADALLDSTEQWVKTLPKRHLL